VWYKQISHKYITHVYALLSGYHMICLLFRDTPSSAAAKFKHKLCRRQHEAVTYEVFYYAVSSIVLYRGMEWTHYN